MVRSTGSQVHSALKPERDQEDVALKITGSVRDCQKSCSIDGVGSLQQDICSFVWSKKRKLAQDDDKDKIINKSLFSPLKKWH